MALANSLPPVDVSVKVHTLRIGPFTYEAARITDRCFTLTAHHTGTARQFPSLEVLNGFVDELREHIARKYPDCFDPTPPDPPLPAHCPLCGRRARRMVANPLDADRQICWRCADGITDELADEAREWRYDRSPVGL
jgi:hypothetical protein